MTEEQVILVDASGREVGVAEKLAAHRDGGRLHLAFSIVVRNSAGELLLQRRAAGKYHFAELWSNTCCGHPRPGETVAGAAERRLHEEFGFRASLRQVARLEYRSTDEASGLTEHELLHVLVGEHDGGEPSPDPAEIGAWRWVTRETLDEEMRKHPGDFTPWFPLVLEAVDG